jgi:hypothetical protein
MHIPKKCIDVASRQIASTATVATAKKKTPATAKIKGILWGAFPKETQSPTAALFFFLRRPIEHVS